MFRFAQQYHPLRMSSTKSCSVLKCETLQLAVSSALASRLCHKNCGNLRGCEINYTLILFLTSSLPSAVLGRTFRGPSGKTIIPQLAAEHSCEGMRTVLARYFIVDACSCDSISRGCHNWMMSNYSLSQPLFDCISE